MGLNKILGNQFYFVRKGIWGNEYGWKIKKVMIEGIKTGANGELLVEFSFDCISYEYPFTYLKSTMEEAKQFALQQIDAEKERQIAQIKKY